MGLLDWFRRRRKKKTDEGNERTRKLRNEIQEHMEEEPNKRKRKKESV